MKIVKVLSQLDNYQLNRLEKFMKSPYMNSSQDLAKWFEAFQHFTTRSSKSNFSSKEDLWQYVFPGVTFSDLRFRKMNSDLIQKIMEFFAVERFKKDKLSYYNYLSESVIEEELDELKTSLVKRGNADFERSLNRSAEFFLEKFFFEKNIFNLTSDFELKKGSRYHVLETNISSINRHLDVFYVAEKLKLYCELHYLKRILNIEEPLLIDDNVIQLAKSFLDQDVIPIKIYYHRLLLYERPEDETPYPALKQTILKDLQHFPPFEAREIFRSVINYCILQINRGNTNYQQEMHEMYLKGLSENILILKNELPISIFRNIILNALRLGHYRWVEDFINEYSAFLPDEHRENAITFNLARTYWYKKDYTKVIELLQFVEYEDVTYNLNAKILLAVSYYELDEIEVLASFIDSFYAYIKRNKSITSNRKKSFISTINFYKRLMRLFPGDKDKIAKLRKDVSEAKGIVNRSWLLAKIDELEGKKVRQSY